MDLGLLNFEIGGDNTKFMQALQQARQEATKLQEDLIPKTGKVDTSTLNMATKGVTESMNNMGNAGTASFGKMDAQAKRLMSTLQWLQKQYDLVEVPPGFMIDAYPIAFKSRDFLLVAITVVFLSWIASILPAIRASRISAFVRHE